MTGEAKQEVETYLRADDRPGAIRYLSDTFGVSPNEAQLLIDALEKEIGVAAVAVSQPVTMGGPTDPDAHLRAEIAQFLQAGLKLEAVNHVRVTLNVGLKEALVIVGQVARETNPNLISFNVKGCMRLVAKGVGIFFLVCAMMLIAAAAIIFFVQEHSIRNSDEVTGEVTAMQTMDPHGVAPVIAYEWQGKKRTYESRNYASPPDYHIGQVISVFVHREEPDEITINSFTDRYALIVGLGVPGTILLSISIVFLYFSKRKF